jgi:methyl-accepting chemotaxis protein
MFGDLPIMAKVLSAVAVAAVVMAFVGFIGIRTEGELHRSSRHMWLQGAVPIVDLENITEDTMTMRVLALKHGIALSTDELDTIQAAMKANDAEVDKDVRAYEATGLDAKRQTLLDALSRDVSKYRDARDGKLIPASRAFDEKTVNRVFEGTLFPIADSYQRTLDKLVKTEVADAQRLDAAANDTYTSGRTQTLAVLFGGLLLAGAAGFVIARMIARPLRKSVTVLDAVAKGDLAQHLDVDSKDEVGQMATALNTTVSTLRNAMQAITENASMLASASQELSAVSQQLASSAEESAAQATSASAAADEVSANVASVATGTEEMSSSIREIATSANDAAAVAAKAVDRAAQTNDIVAKLGDSSVEIGNVINLINSIAEQTNLLALNATIEAARAGDAGKGFAVVASEVKDLAQETAKATSEIGAKVEAIQHDTRSAVDAIAEISDVIARINDTQTVIASSVEEQTATTNEIGRNVSEAASASGSIADSISGVAQAAGETTEGAANAQESATTLARMAEELQALVSQFSY